ncbi:FkbM family methyltransferase [Iamia majanohamensis]|uniref:FkbM family methyltransferase n=1 Tax=Iamia majanohamensis TaxID=467976 RepID=A0AAE9Y5I5_9ACTN|nr:FkbM family methyltransferase [Iamia majanohamensis]WCO65821.1 FkbM family methyltransferase [Iamia majanohamensis]
MSDPSDSTSSRLRHLARSARDRAWSLAGGGGGGEDLAELRAAHDRLAEQLAHQQALIDGLGARTDALEATVGDVAAATGVVDRRNADYDTWTGAIITQALGPGSVGVDVGAHSGLIFEAIRAAAPDARHWAFEPIPELAAHLRATYPDAEVHQLALSDTDGTTSFHHVTSNPSYSGILERDYTGPEEVALIEVEMARMDDVVPDDVAVSFIKIDVEGGELGVLRGASRILREHRPVVVFEFGPGAADHYGTTPHDVFAFFAEHGMSVGLLDRYLRGEAPLTEEELTRHYEGIDFYFVAYPTPGT